MTHPHDNIRVGAITFVYSITKARLGISRPFCYQKSTESTAAG